MSAPAEEKRSFESASSPGVSRGVVFIVGDVLLFEQVSTALSDFPEAEIRVLSIDGLTAEHLTNQATCVVMDAVAEATLSLLQRVYPSHARSSVIVLSEPADMRFAVAAMKAGAWDVLERPLDRDQLRTAVEEALREMAPSPPSTTRFGTKPSPNEASAAVHSLTRRQKAVLERIIEGLPNKTIAAELGICLRTAENHRAAIMRKLHVKSVAGLVQVALAASER